MNSRSGGNSRTTCCGSSKDCVIYTCALVSTTLIFAGIMILSVYFTHIGSMETIIMVLIVGSSLLYLFSFLSIMYSMYYLPRDSMPTENDESPDRLNQITGTSTQSPSSSERPPDVVSFPRPREFFRIIPPPPYDIQMSELSRMLLPGTSGTIESSTRESEIIAEEARKLIIRLYEEIKMNDQLVPQSSTGEQPVKQLVETPKTPIRHQERMSPKISNQNLIIQRQQTDVKSIEGRGQPRVDSRTKPGIQQKVSQSSFPTQLDLDRLIIGSKGCSASPPQRSTSIPGRSPVEFRTKQAIQRKGTSSPLPNHGLERFVIDREECAATPPQLKPRRENLLKVGYKRQLTSPSQRLKSRSKPKGTFSHVDAKDNDTKKIEYEEIEAVENIQRSCSSQPIYDVVEEYQSVQSELDDSSEQASSASSSAIGPANWRRKFKTSPMKGRRQLSALSTRKFYKLGQPPETVLDAIATGFDLTSDEWMFAWDLTQKNVPTSEIARILGVHLYEDSFSDDSQNPRAHTAQRC